MAECPGQAFRLDKEFLDSNQPSGSTGTFVMVQAPSTPGGFLAALRFRATAAPQHACDVGGLETGDATRSGSPRALNRVRQISAPIAVHFWGGLMVRSSPGPELTRKACTRREVDSLCSRHVSCAPCSVW